MKKPLILVGGGGHCKSVLEAAESAGYQILGVLDMPENVGKEVLSAASNTDLQWPPPPTRIKGFFIML